MDSNRRPGPPLSEREQQLIKFASDGYTDTAIANQLGIGQATVSTYWGRIRVKMGPYSRTELVALAIRAESEVALEALHEELERISVLLQSKLASGEAGDLYFAILQHAPDATLVMLLSGEIQFVNLAHCELFGHASHELIGKSISVLVPDRFRELHANHVREYAEAPSRRAMGKHLETKALRADGTEFAIAAALSLFEFGDLNHVVCTIREVTAERILQGMGTPDGSVE